MFERDALRLALVAATLLLCACAMEERGGIDSAILTAPPSLGDGRGNAPSTIPFILDAQRILFNVTFERPGGGTRKALVWFNMGMTAPVLTKALFRELEIDRGRPLALRIGDISFDVAPTVVVDGDGKNIGDPEFAQLFGPHPVEAMLPAGLLQKYVVTIDYRRRLLTLARPGAPKPKGTPVPCKLNAKTGLLSVEAMVDGKAYPVVVDAGAGYSWMRGSVVKEWLATHPRWRRAQGAVGLSNNAMLDYAFEKEGTLARVPDITIGAVELRNVGILGTGPILGPLTDGLIGDIFWDNWQKSAPEPIVGWLGGNALKPFELTIDYPNGMTYWRRDAASDPHDLDQVGVTLVKRPGRYFIGGVVRKANPDTPDSVTVDGVEIGDELVAVDGANVAGFGKDLVLSALHGSPGERRRLVIERHGERRDIDTIVTAFD